MYKKEVMLIKLQLHKIFKISYQLTNTVKKSLLSKQHSLYSNKLGLIARSHPAIMKLTSPEFKSLFTLELMTLASLFENHNYQIRIAGGAVRDLLMGNKPKDLDFATTATPDQMKAMFFQERIRTINNKGESHGTITARINNKENFEITTLRIDKVTDGRHAEVEFTTDWQVDAGRRDLTINSMFLGLDGTLYDYFHGYDDLMKRRVVFVGEPSQRIQEDYLRILRYFRFYGRIAENNENHEEATLKAIRENTGGLSKVSGERIWLELSKILLGNFSSELVVLMLELGVGPHIGLSKNPNINEFKHICSLTKKMSLNAITKLTPLVNDEKEWLSLNTRLKFSCYERDLGLFIIRHRNELSVSYKWCQKITILSNFKGKFSDLQEFIKEFLRYQNAVNVLHDYQKWQVPKFPVGGNDLKSLGVPMGKHVARLIIKLKEYWFEKNFEPNSEEILQQVPEFLNEMGFHFKPKP
uniref:Poly A polymerase head domain-containing protein n=1 Tax=Clastoptera arizonana TaxID=38151 RepID=A0A1B6DJ94_9HEMI